MRAATPLVALALVAGCSAQAAPLATGTRHVVMLSGRDDHGLLESQNLPLTGRPGSGGVVALVASGTLADVLEVRTTRLKVRAGGQTGWIDGYYTLGELRLAGPAPRCTVHLGPTDLPAGTRVEVLAQHGDQVTVRLLDGTQRTGAVPRSQVADLPPAPGRPCPDLGSGRTR